MNKKVIIPSSVSAVAVIGIIAFGFGYKNSHINTFYNKTKIGTTDVSNLTAAQAVDKLNNDFKKNTLVLTQNGKSVETIKVYQYATLASNASVKDALKEQSNVNVINALSGKKTYQYGSIKYNDAAIENLVKNASYVKSSDASTNAKVYYDTKTEKLVLRKEHQGTQYNMSALTKAVVNAVKSGQSKLEIANTDYYIKPALTSTSASIKDQYNRLSKIDHHTITLTCKGKQSVTLKANRFMKYVTYKNGKLSVDETWLKQYANSLNTNFATLGKAMTFTTPNDGKKHTVSGGTYGRIVSVSKEVTQLSKDILSESDVNRSVNTSMSGSDYKNGTFITVSIPNQEVRAYKNGKKILDASVVTGKAEAGRRTTLGAYYIFYKSSPAVLRGPGYASPVSFFAAFHNGQGFHNAPWRSSFGGSIYITNGSHGCVNMTYSDASTIYKNFGIGTPVFVVDN
jgi:lipoprotein-anchoring transpeptidase ErfK/SrfK